MATSLAASDATPSLAVSLTLGADDAAPATLGEPFRFTATITNHLPSPVTGSVAIQVIPPGAGTPRSVQSWFGMVPAGASVPLPRSIVSAQWWTPSGAFTARATSAFWLTAAPIAGVVTSPTAELAFTITPARVRVPMFTDMADQLGITTTLPVGNICQDYAAGAAWGDITGEGRPDLYIPRRVGPSQLWINMGDRFIERASIYGVSNRNPDGTFAVGIGAVFVDDDNNGLQDLFVLNDGVNRLYRNNGDGTLSDITLPAGLADDGNHTSAAWGDYDADGYLDVFVTSHGRRAACEDVFTPGQDHLYHNNGNRTFTDVTYLLPHTGTNMGLGFQAGWVDYDNSGRQSLYLSNDRIAPGDPPNALWRNDGQAANGVWRFTDVSRSSGAGLGLNAMGLAIGDYDRNGYLDLAASNIGSLGLMRNNGDGTFTERAQASGVGRTDQGDGITPVWWGLNFADLANNGWEDLYATAGPLTFATPPQAQPNALFVNNGAGRFLDLSAPSMSDDPGVSRGVAFADFDRDGLIDMLVLDLGAAPRLYHNTTRSGGHWLLIDTVGSVSNRDGCGAVLTATFPGAPPMTREVSCGSTSASSGSDRTVHFGLGDRTSIPTLRIRWPSGTHQMFTDVGVDRLMTVTEEVQP